MFNSAKHFKKKIVHRKSTNVGSTKEKRFFFFNSNSTNPCTFIEEMRSGKSDFSCVGATMNSIHKIKWCSDLVIIKDKCSKQRHSGIQEKTAEKEP